MIIVNVKKDFFDQEQFRVYADDIRVTEAGGLEVVNIDEMNFSTVEVAFAPGTWVSAYRVPSRVEGVEQ